MGTYSVSFSQDKIDKVKAETEINVQNMINKEDNEVFEDINIKRSYDTFYKRVKCPNCCEYQPWSGIPRKWKDAKYFKLWLLIAFFVVFDMLVVLFTSPVLIPLLVPFTIYLLLPLIRKFRRDSAIKKANETEFVPPIYYNDRNLNELYNNPKAAELVEDILSQSNNSK